MIDGLRIIAVIFLSFFGVALLLGALDASERTGLVAFAVWIFVVMIWVLRRSFKTRQVRYDAEKKKWR